MSFKEKKSKDSKPVKRDWSKTTNCRCFSSKCTTCTAYVTEIINGKYSTDCKYKRYDLGFWGNIKDDAKRRKEGRK